MKKVALLLLSFVILLYCEGQIVSLPEGNTFEVQQKFSYEFISANKIDKIEMKEELKPDGQKIKATGRRIIYEFDVLGRTTSIKEITKSKDTLITIFNYVEGRLSCEVKNDAAGFFSYCYTYDKEGLPSALKYSRLGRQTQGNAPTQISSEKLEHKRYEGQLHSTQFNTAERPYRKEIRYYDENGYLLKFISDFVMTSKRREERYSYNERGLLAKREILSPNEDFSTLFEYDDAGNLLASEIHKKGIKVERREYVYRDSNLLLQAELTRDELKQAIKIQSYSYSYR